MSPPGSSSGATKKDTSDFLNEINIACSQNKISSYLHACNIRVTKFGKILSQQHAEVWVESQEGMSPILIFSGGLAVYQVLMIVSVVVDLHQGCGKLWMTQSRGFESDPYQLKSNNTIISHLIPSALSQHLWWYQNPKLSWWERIARWSLTTKSLLASSSTSTNSSTNNITKTHLPLQLLCRL